KKWSLDTLPIIPTIFLTEINAAAKDQYDVIRKIFMDSNTEYIINGTDAGREGELIFRLVYNHMRCNVAVKRLWISSLDEETILQGVKNAKYMSEYNALFESAISRAEADWIVGLNLTRAYTCKYGQNEVLTIGRVQTPVLGMIVNRHNHIVDFKPKDFYELSATIDGEVQFSGHLVNAEGGRKRFDHLEEIEQLKNQLSLSGLVTVEEKEKNMFQPELYDLSALQMEANRRYGFTAAETLTIAQGLYEKKIITYPRTDSRHLTTDFVPKFGTILEKFKDTNYNAFIEEILSKELVITKRFVDETKVTDHHAIIPQTYSKDLIGKEKIIFDMILQRFVTVFMPVHKYLETIIKTTVDDCVFMSKGKVITTNGWKDLYNEVDEEDENLKLPKLEDGQSVKIQNYDILNKKTSNKPYFDDRTLLGAMLSCGSELEDELKESLKDKGIGTVATRAAIIEKLIAIEYVYRQKKNLIPTEKGIKLISIVDEKLKSPEMTGEWEQQLNYIAQNKIDRKRFMGSIEKFADDLVTQIVGSNIDIEFGKEKEKKDEKEVIGICPRCGKNIFESLKAFYCEGFKDEPKCNFSLWKESKWFEARNKNLTKTIVKQLLKNGKSNPQKFKKKDGGEYEGCIILKDDGKFLNFEIEFINNNKK
ncbi:MAG: DNA topoisomerase, partial [Nanoarchaeota archaeon]|nr:DNA topoisomerase [Nanoarchaeota archaeon]